MEGDMLFHEGRDEEIAVVIALLHPERAALPPRRHRLGQGLGLQEVKELAEAGSLLDYFMTYLPDEDAVLFFNKSDAGKAALLKATRNGIKKPRKAKAAPAA